MKIELNLPKLEIWIRNCAMWYAGKNCVLPSIIDWLKVVNHPSGSRQAHCNIYDNVCLIPSNGPGKAQWIILYLNILASI